MNSQDIKILSAVTIALYKNPHDYARIIHVAAGNDAISTAALFVLRTITKRLAPIGLGVGRRAILGLAFSLSKEANVDNRQAGRTMLWTINKLIKKDLRNPHISPTEKMDLRLIQRSMVGYGC